MSKKLKHFINEEHNSLNWRLRVAAGLMFLGLGLFLLALNFTLSKSVSAEQTNSETNLIQNHDWSNFSGANQTIGGVIVRPLNRKIVNQDGSGGQPNPPVNLAGPQLVFSGDLTLKASLQKFDDGDSIRLYGGVPIVYDEWRYEPASIQIKKVNQTIEVSVWDGNDSAPSNIKSFSLTDTNVTNLTIYKHGKRVAISANNKVLGDISARKAFASGSLWFGVDADNDSWTLLSLSAQSPNGVQVKDGLISLKANVSARTLQNLAANQPHPIKIGAAVALNPLLTDINYRTLALEQFSMWTTENELKPQFVHPQPNAYDFKDADLLVGTALKNGIAVHGHTLVFGEANPAWMQTAAPTDRQQIMTDHITTVMTHFKGRIGEWDVINEPLSDNDADYENNGDGLRHHIWYQAMGQSYITTALKAAKSADPKAKLYINDYGLEEDGDRWTAMVKLIKQLQDQGVPLDGIGFEAHVYENSDHVNPSTLRRHIRQLANKGLVARVSEVDVHGDDSSWQAKEYSGVLTACLSEPSCTAFSTWGITDRYGSTTSTDEYPLSYGDDLLWSPDYKAKPAYTNLIQTLQTTASH